MNTPPALHACRSLWPEGWFNIHEDECCGLLGVHHCKVRISERHAECFLSTWDEYSLNNMPFSSLVTPRTIFLKSVDCLGVICMALVLCENLEWAGKTVDCVLEFSAGCASRWEKERWEDRKKEKSEEKPEKREGQQWEIVGGVCGWCCLLDLMMLFVRSVLLWGRLHVFLTYVWIHLYY